MPTVSEYLLDLINQRDRLIEVLKSHGVELSEDELLNTIPDKIEKLADNCNAFVNKNTQGGTVFTYFCKDWYNTETVGWFDTSKGTAFNRMFYGWTNLKTIPKLDTHNGIKFFSMFYGCEQLESVPLIDTSKGNDFNHMFHGCSKIVSVPDFNVSNSSQFESTFVNCTSLTVAPDWDYSRAKLMDNMFSGCVSLKSVPNKMNTSKVTNFSGMFNNCKNLDTIAGIDTSSGINFSCMFRNCTTLSTIPAINISGTTSSYHVASMFSNCSKLTDIRFEGNIYTNGLSFSSSPLLTHDSIVSIINALYDYSNDPEGISDGSSHSVTIGSSLSNATAQEIATAINKGWTLVG